MRRRVPPWGPKKGSRGKRKGFKDLGGREDWSELSAKFGTKGCLLDEPRREDAEKGREGLRLNTPELVGGSFR